MINAPLVLLKKFVLGCLTIGAWLGVHDVHVHPLILEEGALVKKDLLHVEG